MIAQTFKLSLTPDDHPPAPPVVFANQYDVGRPFAAQIYDADGSPYTLTNETVTVCGTKPSGTGFSYTAAASGNTVTFNTTGQMTVVHGTVRCGIIITNGSVVVGSLAFLMRVQPAALQAETIIDSDDFGSIITDAVVAWMDEHGIPIDATLTVSGAAADAKAAGDAIRSNTSAAAEAERLALAAFPQDTASGGVAFFPDGGDGAPVADLTVTMYPSIAGSGDPSPSNVRAISGRTQVTIIRAGKHIYNKLISADTCSNNNGATHTSSDGVLAITPKVDTSASNSGVYFSYSSSTLWNMVYVLRAAGRSATISFEAKASVLPVQMRAGTLTSSSYPNLTTDWARYTATIPASDSGAIVFYANRLAQSSVISIRNVMVSAGDVGAWDTYKGQTYDFAMPSAAGTVYRGTLDATTGALRVTWASVDMGSLTYGWNSNGYFYSTSLRSGSARAPGIDNMLCEKLAVSYAAAASMPDHSIKGLADGADIYLKYSEASGSAATVKSLLNGCKLVYELATPISYTLTPQEVKTLLGYDHIWAANSSSAVTYRADPTLYIGKKIAELQALVLD